MPHYKTLLDPGEFLGPQDFPAPREVTIHRVCAEMLADREDEKKQKKTPMLYLRDKNGGEVPRKFKIPKSVLYGLSELLGSDFATWPGQKITIMSARCLSFGDVEECLRVQFPAAIDQRVRKWLKKRKVNAKVYIIEGSVQMGKGVVDTLPEPPAATAAFDALARVPESLRKGLLIGFNVEDVTQLDPDEVAAFVAACVAKTP